MKKVAKFYKVSIDRFLSDSSLSVEEGRSVYDNIKLPERATKGSAGYDFYSPFDFTLKAGESVVIPTGIRVKIVNGWFLGCYPKSGLGFKYRVQLDNTVGIIDSDYFNGENEGHILIKITNASNENKTLTVKQGQGIVQGIFTEFGITVDDKCEGVRFGGFGSTEKIKM